MTKHKLAAFCISALFSGVAGAMLVFYQGTASVSTVVDIGIGVQIIIAAVLCGRRTILGAVLGSIFLIVAGEFLRLRSGRSQHVPCRSRAARRHPVLSGWPARQRAACEGARMRDNDQRAPLLSVRGLTKRFGGLVAVKDIGFDIRPGEILGLTGPNDSGKSTVMKLIMGIERPNSGSIKAMAWEMAGWLPHRISCPGVASCFSIPGPCIGRPCSNISSSRCCPIPAQARG